jgi:hypothetical protein
MRSIELGYEKKRYNQSEEDNAQNDRDPEQCTLDAAAGSEDTACIGAGQPTQTCSFTLDDHTQNEQDRDYNQRDIYVGNHLQRASLY